MVWSGTRDFGPEEYRLRQWLFGHFEAVSALFGYEQFETPVLESEELFIRKAGEEITQQLYNFEVCFVPAEQYSVPHKRSAASYQEEAMRSASSFIESL